MRESEREWESKSERKKSERCETEKSDPPQFSMSQFNYRTLLRHQMLAGEKKEIEKEWDLIFNKSESDAMKSESMRHTHN